MSEWLTEKKQLQSKQQCKYPVWVNNQITASDEKERILDLISNNPDKELMNEDFELVELIEVE